MASKKHYVLVSVTLGAIAAASGLLIAGTNLLTEKRIEQNKEIKINNGIESIYGKDCEVSLRKEIKNDSYKHVEYVYEIKDSGYAFKTSDSNMYGNITLIIGFNLKNEFMSLSVVNNEQTYAQTLVDNYLNPVNAGERNIDDVSCGATYGATLVRSMINEAKAACEEKIWKQ